MNFSIISGKQKNNSKFSNDVIADFLFKHLEKYGDPREHILACLKYVYEKGGFITVGYDGENTIKGIVVINETGMSGYIPENILVYIAVDAAYRGEGNGRALMEKALSEANGAVALHVEPDNPARYLYENLGFTSKYLEMRYQK